MKSFEVVFESFPQLIFNLYIIMDLQIFDRPLNLASAAISLLSIIYGISDVISFNHYNMTNENLTDSKYVEVPLSKFLWAVFSVIIDITFRTLCIAYLFLIFRFYMFLFPLFYFLLISFSIEDISL